MAERPNELEKVTAMDSELNDEVLVNAKTSEVVSINRSDKVNPEKIETKANADSEDSHQIRENIEETRAEMSETINAIQEKLSFSNISEQVKAEVSDYVGETIQTAKDNVFETFVEKGGMIMNYLDKGINELGDAQIVKSAKRNPLAIGLIGLGLGLLYFSGGKSKKASKYRYDENYERNFSSRNEKSTFTSAQNRVSDAASSVSGAVSSAAGAVSDTVGNAAGAVSETVSGAAGAVSETVGNAANTAYKQAGNLGSKAGDLAGTAQDQYEYYMEENPLAIGAVALALGAAVGLALPSTRIENEYMGKTRNNLLQKAEETARDAVGKVQQVAGQVGESVKKEAKIQGLT